MGGGVETGHEGVNVAGRQPLEHCTSGASPAQQGTINHAIIRGPHFFFIHTATKNGVGTFVCPATQSI